MCHKRIKPQLQRLSINAFPSITTQDFDKSPIVQPPDNTVFQPQFPKHLEAITLFEISGTRLPSFVNSKLRNYYNFLKCTNTMNGARRIRGAKCPLVEVGQYDN